ncbi:MAG: amidase family protein [Gammaproteobacteria bacterium]
MQSKELTLHGKVILERAKSSEDIRRPLGEVLPGGAYFVSEETYRAAVDVHLPRLRQIYRNYFAQTGATAMVFPTTMVTAPSIGVNDVQIRGQAVELGIAIARNIKPGSTVGLPGLVLPAGITNDGLPVTLEFDGPQGSDRTLLAIGLSIERVLGPISPPRMT